MQPPCSGLLESTPQMLWVSCPESHVNSPLATRRTEVLYLCSGLEEQHFFIAFRTFPQPQKNYRKLHCNMVIASQYVQARQDSVYRRLTFDFLRAIFLASHQSLQTVVTVAQCRVWVLISQKLSAAPYRTLHFECGDAWACVRVNACALCLPQCRQEAGTREGQVLYSQAHICASLACFYQQVELITCPRCFQDP